jgi:Arc/MetJ-type ribon-helix-helix transcriptional regulator
MALISFRLSRQLLAAIDELIRQGTYVSRAEAIRSAISQLLLIDAMANMTEKAEVVLSNRVNTKVSHSTHVPDNFADMEDI